MTFLEANRVLSKAELRAIAKVRRTRWYSYLNKLELAHRLFGLDAKVNKYLCVSNQLRRYKVKEPDQADQWQTLLV